jgi:hypothetical protein
LRIGIGTAAQSNESGDCHGERNFEQRLEKVSTWHTSSLDVHLTVSFW